MAMPKNEDVNAEVIGSLLAESKRIFAMLDGQGDLLTPEEWEAALDNLDVWQCRIEVHERCLRTSLQALAKAVSTLERPRPIYGIGPTPEEAIISYAKAHRPDEEVEIDEPLQPLSFPPDLTWGLRWRWGGTSMKAWGCEVPGGYIMTCAM